MKTRWKIIIPILIVAALAAAFFLQGDEPENPVLPAVEAAEPVMVSAEPDPSRSEPSVVEVTEDPITVDAPETPENIEAGSAAQQNETAAEKSEPEILVPEPETAVEPEAPSEEPVETPVAEEPSANEEPAVAEEPVAGEAAEAPVTVTISISCETINDNMADLDPAKTGLVPADGLLLEEVTVELHEGESVFNILQRVCKQNKIHMEFSNTPVYNSAYIEGIGNLYEFDCGPLSGWMYSVNGWYPNYGSSRYELKAGDVICWRYTCDLGADIGGEYSGGLQKDE